MRNLLLLFVMLTGTMGLAQKEINTNRKGVAAEGYDVVAYFDNTAVKGKSAYKATVSGVHYLFSSQANLDTFQKNQSKYIPQYGGWCAYAMGAKNELVAIDPKTFEIRDGKLYLFYNSWGINTLDLWIEEGAEDLKSKADNNWNNR